MQNSCKECDAIVREYRTACLDFWLGANQETRDACRSIVKLVESGTEEDAVRVETHLRPFRPIYAARAEFYGGSTRIRDLIFRKIKHQSETGHYVNLRPGKSPEPDLPEG
jgi:hypothetical protein